MVSISDIYDGVMNKQYMHLGVIEKQVLVFGVIFALLIPISITFTRTSELDTSRELPSISLSRVSAAEISPLADVFLGSDTSLDEIKHIVDAQKAFVSSRKAYPASLAVISKHEITIRQYAREHGVPEDIALGIGLLENGGSENAVSTAGARGIFQLMPGTARNLGLAVSASLDERSDPAKNINAGMLYLRKNYDRFGDWGLSAWAYHAGEGNVVKAIRAYAKANHDIELPGIENFRAHYQYVEEYNITVHKLLSDEAVQQLTSKLNDDSSGYPYKVVATAKLFQESK